MLLIEKDAVWKRFNEDKFWKRQNVHHRPRRRASRRAGCAAWCSGSTRELKLPVYVLVDNDPWGFYIYSVVKQGSINLAYESMRMAVPDGALRRACPPSTRTKYKLPSNVAIKMDDQDNSRAKQMLAYPWFQAKQWQREIQEMVRSGHEVRARGALAARDQLHHRGVPAEEAPGPRLAGVAGAEPSRAGPVPGAPTPRRSRRDARQHEERRMPVKRGNRSKRKVASRSKVKRATAKSKRALSVKRKRRAKRGPR